MYNKYFSKAHKKVLTGNGSVINWPPGHESVNQDNERIRGSGFKRKYLRIQNIGTV
jgi:hypothetical protein